MAYATVRGIPAFSLPPSSYWLGRGAADSEYILSSHIARVAPYIYHLKHDVEGIRSRNPPSVYDRVMKQFVVVNYQTERQFAV